MAQLSPLDSTRFHGTTEAELALHRRLSDVTQALAGALSSALGCEVPSRAAGSLVAELIGGDIVEFPPAMTDPFERHAAVASALRALVARDGIEALREFVSRPLEFVLGVRLPHDPFGE